MAEAPKSPQHWKRLQRNIIVESPYITVYNDTVQLPTGLIIDDYTVAELPSGVVVVATDPDGRLVTMMEYKYAIDKVILNLPSGGIDPGMSVLEAAAKELKEETGYVSNDIEVIDTLYEYPSKLSHVIYVVRAKNAFVKYKVEHEATESIGQVRLLTAGSSDYVGTFNTTYNISALAITLPEFIKN